MKKWFIIILCLSITLILIGFACNAQLKQHSQVQFKQIEGCSISFSKDIYDLLNGLNDDIKSNDVMNNSLHRVINLSNKYDKIILNSKEQNVIENFNSLFLNCVSYGAFHDSKILTQTETEEYIKLLKEAGDKLSKVIE